MLRNLLLLTAIVGLFATQSCKEDVEEPPVVQHEKDTIVEISTSFGNMYLYMYQGTPLHRANFHKLAGEGFYDQTEFHRIIPNFMIQGGDPNSKDMDRTNDGRGGPGYTIPAEINTDKFRHIKGAIAAARLPDQVNPDKESSGSQFYIVVSESGTKHLDGNYTVFGQVLEGVEVADSIVIQRRGTADLPIERIPMTIKLIEKSAEDIKSEYGFDVK